MSYKLIIADDHQLVLEGISAMISEMEGFEIIATANDGKDAVSKVKLLQPDMILLDVEMPKMNGLEAGRVIKQLYPNIKLLYLSMYLEKSLIKKVIELGAAGYIIKSADKEEFQLGLKKIIEGKKYFSSEVSEMLANKDGANKANIKSFTNDQLLSLTERERDVLRLIAEGMTNKEIGEELFISHRTVDTHRTNLMKKLNMHSMAELIRFAYSQGIVSN